MDLLFKLRDAGHTIVVIEHNLDVIGLADHVLEIGPDGGETGGNLVFQGDPLSLSKEKTHTGTFLLKHLAKVQGKV